MAEDESMTLQNLLGSFSDSDSDSEGGTAMETETTTAGSPTAAAEEEEEEVEVRKAYVYDGEAVHLELDALPPLGSKLFTVKLPPTVGDATGEAYVRDEYVDPKLLRELEDPNAAALDIPPDLYMRWREGPGGKRESNTRLVEWEDGSYTLHIGDEAFDVTLNPENRHLDVCINHQDSIEATGKTIDSKVVLRPTGINSRAHATITRAVAAKSANAPRSKIKQTVQTIDADVEREKTLQRIKEKERARAQRARQQERAQRSYSSASYLENGPSFSYRSIKDTAADDGFVVRDNTLDDDGNYQAGGDDDDDDDDEGYVLDSGLIAKSASRRLKRVRDSDDDDDNNNAQEQAPAGEDMEDLFGSDDDEEEDLFGDDDGEEEEGGGEVDEEAEREARLRQAKNAQLPPSKKHKSLS